MTGLLTRRQREVLLLAANGGTSGAIARRLGISPDAVNESLGRAYRALGVHDRTHAVAVALALGEFGLDDIRVPGQRPPAATPVGAPSASRIAGLTRTGPEKGAVRPPKALSAVRRPPPGTASRAAP